MTLTLDPLDRTDTLDHGRFASAFNAAVDHARRSFEASTREHRMEVVLDTTADGGVHRHLTFGQPDSGLWRYHLVTYPGHLVISGDLETFVFRTAYDMVGFFANSGGSKHAPVHPSYWAEKVTAGQVLGEFSNEVFTEQVNQYLAEVRDSYATHNFDKIRAQVDTDLLERGYDHVFQAREAVTDFYLDLDDEPEFRFVDIDHWDFTGYNHHYLVACYAIATGVRRYLAEGGRTVTDPSRC